jgi:hypothetical protein
MFDITRVNPEVRGKIYNDIVHQVNIQVLANILDNIRNQVQIEVCLQIDSNQVLEQVYEQSNV